MKLTKILVLLAFCFSIITFTAIAQDLDEEQQVYMEKLMEAEMQRNVGLAKSHFQVGMIHYNHKKYGLAMEKFLASITTVPSSLGFYYFAVSYSKIDELENRGKIAIIHLHCAIDIAEQNEGDDIRKLAWSAIGDIYTQMGETGYATDAYAKAGIHISNTADSVN